MSAKTGSYIVVFKPDTPDHVIEKAAKDVEASGGKIGHRYDSTMKGFSATVPDQVITTFQAHENLDYIEADGEVTAYAKSVGIGK
ncbi:hypothetical protein PhCBS80983_g04375 [Powellomyces hirtus]|uniref:Inhibitor I9 domain-containing protein n=1 Tax=Powellomyces hirtus TaxID=109895 RepID=A0A507DYQ0_9FUNG|nr:hypothetical protein DFJ77DRAFT_464844 [Powellomyces hirtus]TPX56666.1 hypothetical protein PhCBS80983_g04375 [Powellomyces hirtus]